MATPFIRTNGTTPQIDFGTSQGGVISLTAVDGTANGTVTLPPESCGLMGVIFQQLDDKVVANTTDETSQLGNGGADDTRTIPANMASAGQCYFIRLNGYISNSGTPTGTLRVKLGGGDNGHNGLRSLRSALGTGDFLRVRMGIGRPPGRQAPADFVLTSFPSSLREEVALEVGRAADAVEVLITRGLEAAQNEFNG